MQRSPLSTLSRPPKNHPRKFAPETLSASEWSELAPLFQALLECALPDEAALRRWIANRSELESIIGEEAARLYIAMTCDTADTERATAFTRFIEEIAPRLTPIGDQLDRKLLAHPNAPQLKGEYALWFRSLHSSIELFREENVPIETAIALEVQRYQQLTGGQSAEFDGKQQTLIQLSQLLEERDRPLRERAWRAIAERRAVDRDALDTHFEKLFALRQQVARNSDKVNFIDYIFIAQERWDYTPDDCHAFHSAVEALAVPLYRAQLAERAQQMKLPKLRPWDLSCDPLGRERLQPFQTSDELEEMCETLFAAISPQFSDYFSTMRQLQLLDLDNRPGKAPGGYQSGLDEWRLPFIFMNAVGTTGDLFTLLHEGGHSFHQFLMAHQEPLAHRNPPLEFAEVASMSMELLGLDKLPLLFDVEMVERIRREQLETIPALLCWIAQIDAFQHWLYAHPDHSRQERTTQWLQLEERFGAGEMVDWSGLEPLREIVWQKQLHLFEVPFYYIEYGIAQLGALQVWKRWREKPQEALKAFTSALALGGSQSLRELFSAAGLHFGMERETIAPLLKMVGDELKG